MQRLSDCLLLIKNEHDWEVGLARTLLSLRTRAQSLFRFWSYTHTNVQTVRSVILSTAPLWLLDKCLTQPLVKRISWRALLHTEASRGLQPITGGGFTNASVDEKGLRSFGLCMSISWMLVLLDGEWWPRHGHLQDSLHRNPSNWLFELEKKGHCMTTPWSYIVAIVQLTMELSDQIVLFLSMFLCSVAQH